MRAQAADQQLLLDLAAIDAQLLRIAHRRKNLPEDAELTRLTEQVRQHRDEAVRAQISAEDLDRETARLEKEISSMVDRERKDSAVLAAGNVPPKQLTELEHELGSLRRRQSVLEDELLSVMSHSEAVTADEQRAGAMVTHTEREIAEATARRDAELAALDEEEAANAGKRSAVTSTIDADLLAAYTAITNRGGVGAGLLRARCCGACRMELDRGTLSRVAAAPADEVVRCDECGAIMVRTNESGL